ncbi:MAG: hypothetical protein J1F06_01465 [Prevotellaceae bacterium]|nr:hypothetical protein [Prevotellaceae bacterium]
MKKLLENSFLLRSSLLLLLLAGAEVAAFAQDTFNLTVRVTGTRLMEVRNRMELREVPVSGARVTPVIRQKGKPDIVEEMRRTDEGGELYLRGVSKDFVLNVDATDFGYEIISVDLSRAKLANGSHGDKLLQVKLVSSERQQVIGTSMVQGKSRGIEVDKLPAIVVGDTLQFDLSSVSFEREHFPRNARIVLMPYVLNLTRGTTTVLEPTVLDNTEYHFSQDRLYGFDMKRNEPIGRLMNEQALNEPLAVIWTPDSATVYTKDLLRNAQFAAYRKYKMETDSAFRANQLYNEYLAREYAKAAREKKKSQDGKRTASSKRGENSGTSSFVRTNVEEWNQKKGKKSRKSKDEQKTLADSVYEVPVDPFVERFGPIDDFWARIEGVTKKEDTEKMKDPVAVRRKIDYYKDADAWRNLNEYKPYKVRLENGRDIAVVDLVWQIEDYNKVLWRDTTQVSAGMTRPLEYLQCDFGSAPQLTDEHLWPAPDGTEEMTTDADPIRLNFAQGESTINLSDSLNRANYRKMVDDIATVVNDPKSRILGWSVHGTSSPEGGYNFNVALAQRRLQSLVGMIRREFPNMMSTPKVSSTVLTWDAVIPLLRRDGLKDYADEVENALAPFKEIANEKDRIERQAEVLAKNPQLLELIKEKYLPQLRTVEYEVKYKEYRTRRYEEIQREYDVNPTSLSEYQYFVLLQNETDPERHEQIARYGHERHPRSRYISNALAADLLDRGAADVDILKDYAGIRHAYYDGEARKSAYSRVMARNQLVAQMQKGLYTDMARDSLWVILQNVPAGLCFTDTLGTSARFVAAVAQARLGFADDNTLSTIEGSCLRNNILIKIHDGRDKEAYDVLKPVLTNLTSENKEIREMTDSINHFEALDYMVMSICCLRNNDEDNGGDLLVEALNRDSALYEIAFNDGTLYNYIMEQKDKPAELRKIDIEKILELEDMLDGQKAYAFGLPAGERYNKKVRVLKNNDEMTDEEFDRLLLESTIRRSAQQNMDQ